MKDIEEMPDPKRPFTAEELQGILLARLREHGPANTTALFVYVSTWDKDEDLMLWPRLTRAGEALAQAGLVTRTPREGGGHDFVAVPLPLLAERDYRRRERNLLFIAALAIAVALAAAVLAIHMSHPAPVTQGKAHS